MKTAEELWVLWHQARQLPYGSAQIALIEQMLRHVDSAGDPELAFLTRLLATTAYVYGGEPAKAFVTFSWCVSDFDKNPSDYHQPLQHNLLWQFKAMVTALTRFPEVPLERTYTVLDDMERRYRESGNGMQAVYKHRYLVAEHIGHQDEADEWFAKWQATPRDVLSDCAGCDPTDVADHLASRGRFAEAVAHAEPVLAGELDCSEQPQRILRVLTVPYLMVGRPEDAAAAHRRSYRLERSNLADLADIGAHIEFCARTGNEHRGLELVQRHLDWLDKAPSPHAAMEFAAAGGLLLRRLTELGHGDAAVGRRERSEITVGALATELTARATELAARFDERNGTDRVSRRVAETLAAEPYPAAVPLSPASRLQAPPPPRPAEAAPEVADAPAAELIDQAREHYRADRFPALAATLEALDARFPDLDDPLLAGRREVLRGNLLRLETPGAAQEPWTAAVAHFEAAGEAREASETRARIALDRAGQGEVDEDPIRADVAVQDDQGSLADRADAWARLGLVLLLQDKLSEANEASDRGDEFAARSGDDRLVAMHALQRARNRAAADRIDEAREAARDALAFYAEHGPARWLAETAVLAGHLAETPEERVDLFGTAIESGDPSAALPARAGRGHALKEAGRAGEAIDDLVEAVNLCAEQGVTEGGGFARQELAEAYALAGRPFEAAEVAEEAIPILDRHGHEAAAGNARFLLGQQYRAIGDVSGAFAVFRNLIGRMPDNPRSRGQVGEEAGGMLFDADRDGEAADVFAAAAAALRESGDRVGELRVLRRQIAALHFADRLAEGEEVFRLAMQRYAELPPEFSDDPEAIWQHGMTAFEVGRLLMSRGRHAEAVPHLRGADQPLRRIGANDHANRVSAMYGEALLHSGDPAQAEAHLRGLLDGMPPGAADREFAEKVYAEARQALDR
jgi:cellulose synthase operon protein C